MTTQHPVVSIIIPVYERTDMLVAAVQSIPASTGDIAVETIVVDDGSRVSLEPVVRELPVRFHRLPQNMGSSVARNAGIEIAKGQYLKFLDSDDRLLPGAISTEVHAAHTFEADIVVAGWREVHLHADGSSSVDRVRSAPSFTLIEDDLLQGKGVPTSAALYRAAAVTSVRWDPRLSKLNDWDFFVRAALSSRKIVTSTHLAYDWCSHPGERITTSSSTAREFSEFYATLEKLISSLHMRGALTQTRRRRAAQYLYKELRRRWVIDSAAGRATLARIHELDPDFVPLDEERVGIFRLAARIGLLSSALDAYSFVARRRAERRARE